MALPVVAGGAIATSEAGRNAAQSPDGPNPARAELVEAPFSQAALNKTTQPSDAPAVAPAKAQELPAASATPAATKAEAKDHSAFQPIASYALEQIKKQTGADSSAPPISAVLANPSELDAKRQPCSPGNAAEPAVLIDLDQGGTTFDPSTVAATYDGDDLGHLSRLREAGVTIGWTSALSAENAGAVREALRASGLDVRGEDTLVLFRYPNDRKQTRRLEFAERNCLLAIAGDERADFDELYKYLVRRDGAFALEKLIDNGWFLLPTDAPAKSE